LAQYSAGQHAWLAGNRPNEEERLMKIVVFGQDRRVGALVSDSVIDLNAADPSLPVDLESFIIAGEAALDKAQRVIDNAPGAAVKPLSQIALRAPLAHRGVKICMAGANYADHIFDNMHRQDPSITFDQVREKSRERGISGFWKLSSFVTDPGSDITYPAKTSWLDYEGEVAIVLGKQVKDTKASDLLGSIWGYTLQNDWSARDVGDAPLGSLSWSSQKNWDGSSTIGPCIVVGEISDPQNVDFQTTVNGELRQKGNTKDMTFSFAEYLEHITRDITFNPGDMISAGTCKGTAMDQTPRAGDGFESDKLFLRVGDVVEVSSPQIGSIRNQIVAKR
jgi:2-keto-4-pentenoate hydratase/2-oxohepta-3-ene-1,7-dioic acid hydratase in catechol pathway